MSYDYAQSLEESSHTQTPDLGLVVGNQESEDIKTRKTDPDLAQLHKFKDEIRTLSPKTVKDQISDPKFKARVCLALLIVSGLPDSMKTTALKVMLKDFHTHKDDTNSTNSDLNTVNFYCAFAGQTTPPQNEVLFFQNFCYSFVIYSAIESMFRTRGERLMCMSQPRSNYFYFASETLNQHFNELFAKICYINSHEKERFPIWRKYHAGGLVLMNIWDVGFSKVATYILPRLAGYLSNSFVWLFLDLLRDIHRLYDFPIVPENRDDKSRNDKELIMKWRTCIHYLLRLAKLASSKDESSTERQNVCHVIASLRSSDDSLTSKIEQLRESIDSAAKQLQVNQLIDTENIVVFGDGLVEDLQKILEKIVSNQLNNPIEIPLPYIFLRSTFYDKELLYVKKQKLKELADELEISIEGFREFCRLFTSFGSIIDISLINPSSEWIILKPVPFINELDKLFYPSSDVDPLVAKYGIVTISAAEAIFGQDAAPVYMSFIESLEMSVKLLSNQFDVPLQDDDAYYIPNICNSPPVLKCCPTALHLLHDITVPLSNLKVLFTKKFLSRSQYHKLEMSSKDPHINITRFRAFTSSSADGVVFELVYFGDAIEFRFPDDHDIDEEVCKQIIAVCHEIIPEKVKYNFAIMCLPGEQQKSPYKLVRFQHLLPCEFVCEKCHMEITPAIATWNKILKENEVPENQRLNGDPLTKEDANSLTTKMAELSDEGGIALAQALFPTSFKSYPDKKQWRHYMKMLLEWEESTDGCSKRKESHGPRSKKELSEILYDLSEKMEDSGHDKELLKVMARSINFKVDFKRK